MKSADNHTKRKALVEAFFYRELMSQSGITIPPRGSSLEGQKYTQPRHTVCDMHVCMHTDTQWHCLQCTHTQNWKNRDVSVCFLSTLANAFSLPLSSGEVSHSTLTLHHYPPVCPSVHLVLQSALSVRLSADIILCTPFMLGERISTSETEVISQSRMDGRPAAAKTSRLSHKQDNRHVRRVFTSTGIRTPFIFLLSLCMHLHISSNTFPMHQHLCKSWPLTHVQLVGGRKKKKKNRP